MRQGVEIVTLGPYADPRACVEVAVAAEEAGFELVAVWDHHAFVWGIPSADPIVTLAAIAQATTRIRLLPFVLALPRHKPHVLAQQLAQVDVLSGGRLVVGAGLGGVPAEFDAYGEPSSAATRAQQTDEALAVIAGLWSGAAVEHAGAHYRVTGVTLSPLPIQRPRPPVWIGGESGPALRRAARWDGWAGSGVDEHGNMIHAPSAIATIRDRLAAAGAPVGAGFDLCTSGTSRGRSAGNPADYGTAGVTWWLETISPSFGDTAEMLARVRAGPTA